MSPAYRLCFVAGDPSGDTHAARLITALKARDPSLMFSGLGGPAMQRAGMTLLENLTEAAAIGPFDAAKHLGRFVRAKQLLDAHLVSQRPDLVILVDFGDYNLPVIAPLVHRHRIPMLYYISPQVWAWGRWRLRAIRRYVSRVLVLFPFEERFYQRAGIPVTWVGHPLLDDAQPTLSREAALERFGLNPWRMTVGLLPGSREAEVRRHWPLMLEVARRIAWRMPGVQFLVPRAPSVSAKALTIPAEPQRADVRIAEGSVYDALQLMDAAVIASGTATLEAALMQVPMVVVYRTSWPTYFAARAVVRIPHIAIVNVVAQRQVVPEFVQSQATPEAVSRALIELLRDEQRREAMKTALREVTAQLGPPGAVERAVDAVLVTLEKAKRSGVLMW